MTLSKSVFTLAVATMLALFSVSGFATETEQPGAAMDKASTTEKPAFDKVDANQDGFITPDEAKDCWLADVFTKVDTNQDGVVNRSEYETALS
jgi:hypothetical protein